VTSHVAATSEREMILVVTISQREMILEAISVAEMIPAHLPVATLKKNHVKKNSRNGK
jgi:hypothetical protein